MLTNQCISFEEFKKYVPETFIPISNYIIPEIVPIYIISNYGRVINIETNNEIGKAPKDKTRYCQILVNLINGSTRMLQVHRLVLCCFFPNFIGFGYDCGFDVNHKNGIKSENFIDPNNPYNGNLEWTTRKENIQHSYSTNLHKSGEDASFSTITNNEAKQIINLLSEGKYTSKQIIDIIGNPNIKTNIIDSIRKKESWKQFSNGVEFKQRINRLFTEQDVHNFCKVFQEIASIKGLSNNERCAIALKRYGFEASLRNIETVRKIYVRKYYKQIVSQYAF